MAKKTYPTPAIEPEVINPQLEEDHGALDVVRDMNTAIRQEAQRLGYQLPGDCIDPDIIQRDIAVNMRRSVEACLEVGRALAVLRVACGHGDFTERLNALKIEGSVARRFISAARKFSNRATSHDLTRAIGNQSKLFELIVLDDEQVEELAETGETTGITLDEIECMSVSELRQALRKTKREKEDEVAAARNAKASRDARINELQNELDQKHRELIALTEGGTVELEPTPELQESRALAALNLKTTQVIAEIDAGLRKYLGELEAVFDDSGDGVPSRVRLVEQQAIARVMTAARVLASDFGITLTITDETPAELAWLNNSAVLDGLTVPETVGGTA